MRKIFWVFIATFTVLITLNITSKETQENNVPLQQAGVFTNSFGLSESFIQSKPDTLSWKLLGVIKYIKKPNKDFPEGVMYPIINSTLKEKNKKKIVMSGFIIPVDNVTYALSKNVFASCFFCGQAGPETIMGIKFKGTTPRLKTDQYVTLEGTFRYNDSDVDDWIYHIDDAVIVKGK
ncbi:MAG: hypothetical protein RBR78_05465 [Flavobacteriaceae bacterium]|jgi:hypothetical protein|nr:hypothetical protein [Flavobacteriaceae bacterium]